MLYGGDYLLSVDSELNIEGLKRNIETLFDGTNSNDAKALKKILVISVELNEISDSWVNLMSQHFLRVRGILLRYDQDPHQADIDIDCILKCKSPVESDKYEFLLRKVEFQLNKVPKISEQRKQLRVLKCHFDVYGSDLFFTIDYEAYKDKVSNLCSLADEIFSNEFHKADYEAYKNKVEKFECEFEKFNEGLKLKNNDNQVDDGKKSGENKIGNGDDSKRLKRKDVAEERLNNSNSEYSKGRICNCLKNILLCRVFFCLSLLSLLLLIISVYCLIVTAIFLLASLVLYFIQKTKKDNDNMEVMAENLSSEINPKHNRDWLSVDSNRDDNVKQKNEFSLFGRANDGIN